MKKILAVVFIVTLLIAVLSTAVTANEILGEVPTAKGISVDGVKDAVYNDGLILNFKDDTTGTGAVIHLLWEPGWLYAFAEVTDSTRAFTQTDDELYAVPYGVDCMQFFINPDGQGNHLTLYRTTYHNDSFPSMQVRVEGLSAENFIGKAEVGSQFTHKGVETANGYVIEGKFPLFDAAVNGQVAVLFRAYDKADNGDELPSPMIASVGVWDVQDYPFITLSGKEVSAAPAEPEQPEKTEAEVPAPASEQPGTEASVSTPVQVSAVVAPRTGDFSMFAIFASSVAIIAVAVILKKKKSSSK